MILPHCKIKASMLLLIVRIQYVSNSMRFEPEIERVVFLNMLRTWHASAQDTHKAAY